MTSIAKSPNNKDYAVNIDYKPFLRLLNQFTIA